VSILARISIPAPSLSFSLVSFNRKNAKLELVPLLDWTEKRGRGNVCGLRHRYPKIEKQKGCKEKFRHRKKTKKTPQRYF